MTDAFRTIPEMAPPIPRELTPDIATDSAAHGRFLRTFGGIWTTVGLGLALLFSFLALALELRTYSLGAGLVSAFGIVGGTLWMIGWWQRAMALRTYRDGVEVRGVVTEVYQDLRVRMNGRSPWRVAYEYVAAGRPMTGKATFWDPAPPRVAAGDRVVVLHASDRPSRSVLWTRFDRDPPMPALAGTNVRIGAAETPAMKDAIEGRVDLGEEEMEAGGEVETVDGERRVG